MRFWIGIAAGALLLSIGSGLPARLGAQAPAEPRSGEWRYYAGDSGSTKYLAPRPNRPTEREGPSDRLALAS